MARSKYELLAQKELEKEGYVCDYKCRPFRTPKNYHIDILGLFDLLAYRPGELRFIAIKGRQGVPSKLRQGIRELAVPPGVIKEIWNYHKGRKLGTLVKEIIPT